MMFCLVIFYGILPLSDNLTLLGVKGNSRRETYSRCPPELGCYMAEILDGLATGTDRFGFNITENTGSLLLSGQNQHPLTTD